MLIGFKQGTEIITIQAREKACPSKASINRQKKQVLSPERLFVTKKIEHSMTHNPFSSKNKIDPPCSPSLLTLHEIRAQIQTYAKPTFVANSSDIHEANAEQSAWCAGKRSQNGASGGHKNAGSKMPSDSFISHQNGKSKRASQPKTRLCALPSKKTTCSSS